MLNVEKCFTILRCLGNVKTMPLGTFTKTVWVVGAEVEQKFVVVPDKNIEDDILLGFDIASRFRVTLDEKAFTFKKVPARPDNRHNQLYNFVENKNNLGVFEQFTITSQLNFQTSVLYKCGS